MTTSAPGEELLDLPARRASRLVALLLLERASVAHARLLDPDDPEALHDFRVAVRRLRSWVRAFRPWLSESVPRRLRRRLRALADATSASRDAEVHIAWIAAQQKRLTPRQRTGARWLEQRLATAKAHSDVRLQAVVSQRFTRIHDALKDSLSRYTLQVSLHEEPRETRFAGVLAALVREHAAELRNQLDAVHVYGDQHEGHRARIAGKRLRYLLEPIAPIIPAAAPLIDRLKSLQDALGDVNDTHVFAGELTTALQESAAEQARALSHSVLAATDEGASLRKARGRDPRPGLVALARLLRERGEEAFARVESEWLEGRGEGFFADVESLAASFDERRTPGIEIERKYLLASLPDRARDGVVSEIEQGYVPGRRLIERLRRVSGDGDDRYVRTVKGGMGLSRLELEEQTTREIFRRMWPLTKGHRLTKRRYTVADGAHVWEIDEFTDRELVLAEVELPATDAAVEVPDWLSVHLVREVTGDPAYSNSQLAK